MTSPGDSLNNSYYEIDIKWKLKRYNYFGNLIYYPNRPILEHCHMELSELKCDETWDKFQTGVGEEF